MLELNKIYCGDCLKLMREIDSNSVDLIVTDPPYGFNEFGSWSIKDAQEFWNNLFEYDHLLKAGGSFYSFTGWKYYCEARRAMSNSLNIKYLKTLIWDKRTFIGTRGDIKTLTYHNISEPIIFGYHDGRDLTFNLEDIRIRTIHKDKRSNPRGKRPGDIINYISLRSNSKEKVNHKGQKPLELIKFFIKASSNENDLILDPFIGSGTTAVACIQTNRNFIGMEISPEYCKIANKRIEYEKSQLKLEL